MIFIYLRLPYRRQLKAADPATIAAIDAAAELAAEELGGKARWFEERALISFDETGSCAALRAAEALRTLGEALGRGAANLHGYTLVAEQGSGDPAMIAENLDHVWLLHPKDGTWATEAAASLLGAFVRFGEASDPVKPVQGFGSAEPPLPKGWKPPAPPKGAIDRLAAEIKSASSSPDTRRFLGVEGAGEAPASLLAESFAAAGIGGESILTVHAGNEDSPLAPFLGLPRPADDDQSEAAMAARLVAASPCRRRFHPALLEGYAEYVHRSLAAWRARTTGEGYLVLHGVDRFSAEALGLIAKVFGDEFGPERLSLVIALGEEIPRALRQFVGKSIPAPHLDPRAIAAAAAEGAAALGDPGLAAPLAAAARGESLRLTLALRLAASGDAEGRRILGENGVPTSRLADLVLDGLPREYRGWLRALALAEDLLDDRAFDEFLDASGYRRGIRPLISQSFATLGLVDSGRRPRLTREASESLSRRPAGEFAGVDAAFAEELRRVHAKKLAMPSLAFQRRLATISPEDLHRPALFLDALAADIAGGPSLGRQEVLAPGATYEACIPLLVSWTEDDGAAAKAALEAFAAQASRESSTAPAQALLALARAVEDFSQGMKVEAAQVRNAIMRLHELGVLRLEAKAHRLLGLIALAGGQVPEGSDYLANARELAVGIPDGLESFFASQAAASAYFTLGDIRRAGFWIDRAAESARTAFRPDWAMGARFAQARIEFELGRYGRAEELFEELAENARIIGADAAEVRAVVWAGRAAAWSGMGSRTRARLSGIAGDAEASWFLAELASWEGDWQEAARLAAGALGAIPRRAYRPIDALSWNSGFDLLEGPCLGPWPGSTYLEDQIAAFESFVWTMATGQPDRLPGLAARSREGRLAHHHPQAHLYDWFAFIACETMETPPFDPGTLLSRAWKALQTRTLRMDEAALKAQFLEGNRWNREIVAAARARRLI